MVLPRLVLPAGDVDLRFFFVQILNPGIGCHSSDTYGAVLQKLGATRVHRIYIVDSRWHPVGVLSLGDALLPLVSE